MVNTGLVTVELPRKLKWLRKSNLGIGVETTEERERAREIERMCEREREWRRRREI